MSDTEIARGERDEKVTVRLPAALRAQVDEAARRCGVGRSELVRRALAAQIQEVLGRKTAPEESLYDVLNRAGVIGRFEGPPTLSTTPRQVLRARIAARSAPRAASPA